MRHKPGHALLGQSRVSQETPRASGRVAGTYSPGKSHPARLAPFPGGYRFVTPLQGIRKVDTPAPMRRFVHRSGGIPELRAPLHAKDVKPIHPPQGTDHA